MAYERLAEALRQLRTDREREEATEKQQKRAGEEARMRFAQIKSAVIGPIFYEVVAHLVAEGFFGKRWTNKAMGLTQFPATWIYRTMKDSVGKAPSKYGLISINMDANLVNLR
jgi:hypothetical protein